MKVRAKGVLVLGALASGVLGALSQWSLEDLLKPYAQLAIVCIIAVTLAVIVAGSLLDGALARAYYRLKVAKWTGVQRVYTVQSYATPADVQVKQREAAEQSLTELARVEPKLSLLLASGYRYLGTRRQPGILHHALEERCRSNSVKPTLEVLLLNPTTVTTEPSSLAAGKPRLDAEEIGRRIEGQGFKRDEYALGINAVLWTLRCWKRDLGLDVHVYLYDEPPIWQMVVTEKELWLLCAMSERSDRSPIYCLRRDSPYGLAHGLMAVWERRRRRAEEIDLTTIAEPDLGLVKHHPVAGNGLDDRG